MDTLRFFDKDFRFTNRTVCNVYVSTQQTDRSLPSADCTRFILGIDCQIKTKDFSATGTFAATTNQDLEISGDWIIVETPGYSFLENRLSTCKSGHPANLCYIDGCSNSNLIDPPRNGEPCVNYLYFPPGINQTFHTHPSLRLGTILSGEGIADLGHNKIKLCKGDRFILDSHAVHRFVTENDHMSIMIFHPDSEDGPRDENNPMRSRTYIR